jgi:hypothetical protein
VTQRAPIDPWYHLALWVGITSLDFHGGEFT